MAETSHIKSHPAIGPSAIAKKVRRQQAFSLARNPSHKNPMNIIRPRSILGVDASHIDGTGEPCSRDKNNQVIAEVTHAKTPAMASQCPGCNWPAQPRRLQSNIAAATNR
jgi:hypothetical protein